MTGLVEAGDEKRPHGTDRRVLLDLRRGSPQGPLEAIADVPRGEPDEVPTVEVVAVHAAEELPVRCVGRLELETGDLGRGGKERRDGKTQGHGGRGNRRSQRYAECLQGVARMRETLPGSTAPVEEVGSVPRRYLVGKADASANSWIRVSDPTDLLHALRTEKVTGRPPAFRAWSPDATAIMPDQVWNAPPPVRRVIGRPTSAGSAPCGRSPSLRECAPPPRGCATTVAGR